MCVTASISPPNDLSQNRPADDHPTAALGVDTKVSKHTSVLMLPALAPHPRRVCEPPTMIFASSGDVVLPPSLVVASLEMTYDIGTAAAASVAQLVIFDYSHTCRAVQRCTAAVSLIYLTAGSRPND